MWFRRPKPDYQFRDRPTNAKKIARLRKRFEIEAIEGRLLLSVSAIPTVADSGTPFDPNAPSANVSQAITITGSNFTPTSVVSFSIIDHNTGAISTQNATPTRVAADGTNLDVIVPDQAMTAIVRVDGLASPKALQIVPTIVDIDLTTSTFATGSSFTILGSGFIEGDMTIRFGATEVVDTSISSGPDVFSVTVGAGFDKAGNDGVSVAVPAGAATGPITVKTAGGTSAPLLVSLSQITSQALEGTPALSTQASANPGQSIRVLGSGFDYTTDVIFPTIGITGVLSNTVVNPHFISPNGTLMEVIVPDDATSGSVRVVGAAGAFALQVVPTLELVEDFGTNQFRLLGSGFTEDANLSVNFTGAPAVIDSGASIDVTTSFLANDTLTVTKPAAGIGPVSVTTAGGTSASVAISVDRPASVTGLNDLAIFPVTAGADAGRLLVTDASGNISVLDPATLAVIRTITRPGTAGALVGLTFLGDATVVQDAVRGNVNVPAGSLVVVNGNDLPDRLYYLNPAGAGTVLADVALAGPTPVDENGASSVVYHSGRKTFFVLRSGTDVVTEINPATGAAIQSFHIGGAVSNGGIAVHPVRGTLLVGGNSSALEEVDPVTGRLIGNYDPVGNVQLGSIDLRQEGVSFQGFGDVSGLAFNSSGQLLASVAGGRILPISLPSAPTALRVNSVLAQALAGNPADPLSPSANAGQRISLLGSGYSLSTQVEFEIVSNGVRTFQRVQVDAVNATGTEIQVVVPTKAVTGKVKVSGAPGDGLFLQIVPTIRPIIPTDGNPNFGDPIEGLSYRFFGTGLVEGATTITMGGIIIDDNSASGLVSEGGGWYQFVLPERTLAGPIRVDTAGGNYTVATVPIDSQKSVGLTAIVASSSTGTPTNVGLPSANTAQLITLQGYGFTSSSNIIFQGVAHDGTRSVIVTRPSSVTNGGLMTVIVPDLAVTGLVTVAGSATSIQLQIVPTLDGISVNTLTPGAAIRLSGTGIPEGGPGVGENVVYAFGAGSVTDISAITGPDVFSALEKADEIDLNVPGGSTGSVVTVTTAGGTAILQLSNLTTPVVAAEPQGAAAVDGVGGTLATARNVPLDDNTRLTLSGRVNVAQDVDVYQLVGAQRGAILSISLTVGNSIGLVLFDGNGVALTSPSFNSFANLVLPAAGTYYLGVSGWSNVNYNVVTGAGAINGTVGDYTLSLRYSDPGTTSLNAITTTAARGIPTNPVIASANTGQTITITGENFDATTRVRFTTFNSNSPQTGLGETEVIPTSVAGNGLSLQVVVPTEAVTGVVRLTPESGGLILQIVPFINDYDTTSGTYEDGSNLQFTGGGFVEGAQTLIMGTAIGAGGATEVTDLWNFTGPDTFNSGTQNSGVNFAIPGLPPTGPFLIRTLGGTSDSPVTSFTSITSTSSLGTPASALLPSANVRQAITLHGSGFNAQTEIVFVIRSSSSTDADVLLTTILNPSQVSADGTSLQVLVPDNAATGNIHVVGAEDGVFLQVVPTLVQVITPSPFITGGTMTIRGSGFTENDIQIVLGGTVLKDTNAFFGPDVYNSTIGAGLDRNDNDHINFLLPPGASTAPLIIRTAGGEATLVSVNGIQGLALEGTPANAAIPSANAGQTIRIFGQGLNLSTEVIFQIVDTFGNLSTVVLRPDLASTDGTLAELRVPDNAITGAIQVVGAAGTFALQIVPTLKLVEEDPGTRLLRMLGGGFTDDRNLSVNFTVGGSITDTGTSIDVSNNSNFLVNDTLYVTRPVGATGPVSVTTAGGTSSAVAIPNDEPASIAGIYDLAVFPTTAGADTGHYVIADSNGSLQVIDQTTLALIRNITRPGTAGTLIGVTFLGAPVVVQDAVRGAVTVAAGSMVVVNGNDLPDRLYYLNPAGSGTILADVVLGGPTPVDDNGATSVVYHSGRGTLFVQRNNTDLITEINPATGAAIQSFHSGYNASGGRGALAVHPVRGTLLVGNDGTTLVEIDPATGRLVGHYDAVTNTQHGALNLVQEGVSFESFGSVSGLAFNNAGQLFATALGGRILDLTLPSAPTAIQLANGSMAVAIDGVPANSSLPSANARQRIRIVGAGYNRFTQVEFQTIGSGPGLEGFISVRVDAVSGDGTAIEVVVPDTAVTGFVRIAGVPGGDLFLQITPTIRATLPSDPNINFDVPVEEQRWGLFGSGLVEGNTVVTFGGIVIADNSGDSLIDIQSVSGTNYTRDNGRLDLNVPIGALAGPVRVTTAGGYFEVPTIPIESQESVGLTAIVSAAPVGTPSNALLPSANTGQVITLQGFGFTSTSNIIFQGVALDGTRGVIVVRPTSVASLTQMTVQVPERAITGAVTVAGSTTSVDLQIVPTLDGINVGLLTPGAAIRLSGSGIPEGGPGAGQQVTYTFGAGSVVDNGGSSGPDVFSALDEAVEISLNAPGGATGTTLTVTTLGGSATLQLANVTKPVVNSEPQGAATADGVGATLVSAANLALDHNTQLTVNGRVNTATDIDVYHLNGVQRGGVLSVTAVGGQGNSMSLILFDGNGAVLNGAVFNSFINLLLPVSGDYYLGVTGWAFTNYSVLTGTGTGSGATGDYALTVRYADAGATSLNAITTTAARGTPANPSIASANTGQTITITGENFDANTRVRFTTFNGNSPQNGLTESPDIIPTSVAGDGLSLQVVVPADAVTGPVRLTAEPGGLILQIVPFINDYDMTSASYDDGSNLQLNGGGFVEGAQSVLIGSSGLERADVWNNTGADVFNSGGTNNFVNVALPRQAPTGPFAIRTLGGTSDTAVVTFTGITATAAQGTPANALLPATNVREGITLSGTGFNAQTEVVFMVRDSQSTDSDIVGTQIVNPSQVAADGTSLQVLVPDTAVTGNIRVVGSSAAFFLQIVPTLVQIITPSPFITGGTMTITGSGFTENDIQIVLGNTILRDTSAFFGPDVYNAGIGAGFDRNDNDHINLVLPPGTTTSSIRIITSGGEASISQTAQIQSVALSGTPANAGVASANAGQTIRIVGVGLTLSTEVIFPIIDTFGNISTIVLRPDLVSTNGTLAEIRVPDNAVTGTLQVVGAAGSFALQIVPTLKLAEEDPGTRLLRVLGGGFTDDSNLSVNFAVGGSIIDNGASIDVFNNNNFIANDTLYVTRPVGASGPITVTTAGGTSAPVAIPNDEPTSIAGIYDLAIFPTTAGADAGRYLIADSAGALQVIDPVTLTKIRDFARPGITSSFLGVTFLGAPIVVQDAVRGAVNVPAGSLVVVNGTDNPDRLYYMNTVGSGTVLADVALGGLVPVDEGGATSVVYHSGRGTLFVMRNNTDLITEINPSTGAAIQSFHTNYTVSGGRGALAVHPVRGTLLIGGSTGVLVEIDPDTGRAIGNYSAETNTQFGAENLSQDGVNFENFGDLSGMAFNGSGQLIASVFGGRIIRLTLPSAPTAIQLANGSMAVAIDGVPANASLPSANARQRIRIVGSGYNRFTQVEFQAVPSGSGSDSFVSVRADAVSADGTMIDVVVPDTAVTGFVRISGVSGGDLYLQITPTIRTPLPSDPAINFNIPVAEQRWGLFGSGLVEGNTVVTIGGIVVDDNSTDSFVDVQSVSGTNYTRDNGRLDLNIPPRALAGPLRVTTDGGYFEVPSSPIASQELVGLTAIVASASMGTPANAGLPSANTGQVITLQGFGFTGSSLITFQAVAHDGTRGVIVVAPTSVTSLTQMTVTVPDVAVTGAVTVAGSTTSVNLQVVPTLDGINVGLLAPGAAIRLSGTGIPEGGAAAGQQVTYTVGAGSVIDTSGSTGPDVFSAVAEAVEINLNLPAGATGTLLTVTTAGGSATLQLANVTTPTLNAEAQGAAAVDAVGASLATTLNVTVDDNTRLTVNGRINTASDVDLYHLIGAQRGGILSVSAVGLQSNSMGLILFDGSGTVLAGPSFNAFSNFLLPAAGDYYLGVSGWANTTYNVITGTGTGTGATGDYALTLRYADPGATSLNAITSTATRGTPANPAFASANTGQTITITGENFDANTRVRFTTFNANAPQNGLTESEVIPTSVAGNGLSLQVVVPVDAVTGPVRLTPEPGGLILQIVPFINDYDMTSSTYDDGSNLQINGGGFVEGAESLLIGTSGLVKADLWNFSGPDAFNSAGTNNFINVGLPVLPPTGPFYIRTLGGTSDTPVITFTGVAPGTVADRGTPTDTGLPSLNVRETLTLLGSGFNAQTEIVFVVRDSSSGNSDIEQTTIVNPASVAANGTSLTVVVPDTAATGFVHIVGVEDGFFLQIVPTIVQVILPGTFATGQNLGIQGSGFIENDVVIGVGNTFVLDTSAFFGPDVFNTNINLAGLDRADNDAINVAVPPGGTPGPWTVTTAGGTARFGVIIDLGVVIYETSLNRTVAPGEQELFKATASIDGWLDWEVHYSGASTANLKVLNQDGTDATLVDFVTNGPDVLLRVSANKSQIFFLRTNGVGTVAAYDVKATNHDRFDDPVGAQAKPFRGSYGTDPDGRNDTAIKATDFTPAVYVLEDLSIPVGDTDWLTWDAQATGQMTVSALFTAANGVLRFRVYTDANNNDILDPAELAAPIASSPNASGASSPVLPAARGQRFWVEVFAIDGNSDGVLDRNLYNLTFSNIDLVDAGLLAGHPANNDTRANAVEMGFGVAWNSSTITDALTIHNPSDIDWFGFTTAVPGTLTVLIDLEHPLVGQLVANVVDANTGVGLTLLEFENSGTRLRFLFSPVSADQHLNLQISGQPNAYKFSVQNNDVREPDPTMAQPANLGLVVHQLLPQLSLPGLPDVGTRDDDWYQLITAAPDGQLRVTATVDPVTGGGGNVTVNIWRDSNGNGIPESGLGELVATGTSVGGAPVTVNALAGQLETFFVQVFNPASGPLTGLEYTLDVADVDRFDRVAPNETSATATNFGSIVDRSEPGLTLLPFDQDWYKASMRAKDGTMNVLVNGQFDRLVINVFRDTNSDGTPDTLVATKAGKIFSIEDIPAVKNETLWIQVVLETPSNASAVGALYDLEVLNPDRYDDPLGDSVGGVVINPTGHDPDGPNDGPRTTGNVVEGTLRLVQPDPLVPSTMQGHVGVSVDGLGTFTTGSLQAVIPTGSTVQYAFLYVATRSFSTPYRPTGIGFAGSTVSLTYLPNVDNATGVDFETGRANVTSLVQGIVGSGGATYNFAVDERIANAALSADGNDNDLQKGIEGTALVVIYSNPTLPIRSIAILEGGLSGPAIQTTRMSLATPVNKADPNFIAQLSLGISFSFQPLGQSSTVNVNGTRMTSSAGNFNDGVAGNGALVTVGGVGDSSANPPDPFNGGDTTDDELYDLSPFLTNGDREIVMETANPSDDDSIFLAVITVSGNAGVASLFTDLGTIGDVHEVDMTLPATDQDWYRIKAGETGDLVATATFESDGSAKALMFRDADDDGLPDDLNDDGVPDSIGVATIGPNSVTISNVPGVTVGAVFLLRVFDPVGQVEYNLDLTINQAPVAVADSYTTAEDTVLNISAPGVLANDSDSDGNPLTSLLNSGVSHGILTLNGNGSFTYTPTANYNGPDSFTYHDTDGLSNSNVVTVSITVTPVNDSPVAANDSYTTNEDTPLTIAVPGVLANDTDVDGNSLTSILNAGVSHGILTLNPNGSFTYTPTANYSGPDSFTYHANDGTLSSNIATVSITVTPVNDAPIAVNDSYTTNEDTVLNIVAPGVLANDTDADGNALTSVLNTTTSNGVLTLNANGSFTYTPNANFNGTDSFTYHANDSTANSNIATVTITVTPVNDAPVAVNDSYTTNEDTLLTIAAPGVLSNDTDVDGNPLTSILDTGVSHGILTLNANGSFTYTPTANYNGPDSFTYHATDSTLNSNIATVTITVTPVNDAPVAVNDSYTTNEDTPLTIAAPGVLGNDTDVDSVTLTAVLNTTTTNGSLTLNGIGSFTYTPNANFNGTDSFTYHANDGTANSNIATVTITVTPVNDAPVAVNDAYSTNEDTPLTIAAPGILGNDTDVDSVTLTAVLNTTTANGLLTLNGVGSFTYTPNANFNGSDSFTYHATDGTASSNIATVTITVNPVNDAPVAVNDSYTTNEDTPLTIAVPGVLANDTDVDGNPLTAILNVGPVSGTLALNSNGSFTYTPNANFNGSDSFTYHAFDGTASSNIATVTITVTPVNDAPVAVNDAYSTNEDTPLTIAAPGVLANDTDVDSVSLTAVLNTTTSHGVLTLNSTGSFTYTPAANFNGTDSFTYHSADGTANSNIATVTITVNPVNDAPVAVNDSYTTNEDTPLTIAVPGVLANDTDVDGNPLTAILNVGPVSGTLALNSNGSFTYTPNANFNGSDSFTYHAFDGTASSNIATVSITINAVNDALVANNDSYTTNEDTTLNIAAPGVLANDLDVDGTPITAVLNVGPTSGVVTLNANGSFTYTPSANFNGTDSFTYHESDGTLNSNIATVTITVTPVNDAPVAANDSYATNEDTTLTITAPGVLGNDTDVDTGSLTAVLNTTTTNGSLTLNAAGSFTYTPNANFNGTDSFTYHASDGTLNSNIATVTITVTPVNDAPVANNDSYTTNEDTPLTIAAPGILANDADIDSGSLTAALNTTTTKGALTLNANGSFTYTPNANFNGTDSFTYHANDGAANSNIATVTITVTPVNDAPVANNDTYSTNEDGTLTVVAPGVLANDTDVEGSPLTAVLNVGPASGNLTLNANGSFTYTPNANFNGTDSFTYHANDGTLNSNIATVTITVNAVNDAPVANNDSYAVNEDGTLNMVAPGVLANDTDVDGNPLTAALNVGPASGSLTLNANGSFTYTPNANFNGTDSFTYHANDGTLNSNIATVTITVNAVNDAPVANNDTYATNQNTLLSIAAPGVLSNDTDIEGSSLSAVLNVGPASGVLSLNANGSFTYTPNTNFSGTDSFTYHANDGTANSNIATVTIAVNSVNGAPVANNDAYSVNEDGALNVAAAGVLANDTDADGNTLTALLGTGPASGGLTLNANGSFTYTPNANFNGTDSFTYRANDGTTNSNLATVTVTVNPVNDAPVANNDAYSVNEDGTLNVAAAGVLANDTDVDGNPLASVLATGPTSGSLTLNPNGSFTYTPNANFNGTDSFTYRANDGTVNSNAATVTITVNAVNDAPVANNDAYSVNEDGTLNIVAPGVLANDTDVEGSPLTAALATGPTSGSLTLNPNGSFIYTPNANFNGTDSFTYRASDGTANSNTATVTITVNPVNDAPVANNDAYSVNEDGTLNIAAAGVLANDTDVDGNPLTAVLGTGPASGALTLNANGSITYTPNANFNGTDSFTYRANDGTVNSNLATVTITVNPVNDTPVANNDAYSVNEDGTLNVAAAGVLINDTDVDGNPLTSVLGTGPASGSLTLNPNGSFTYTPNANFNGTDSFTYRANDGTVNSNAATVTITVNAVNDAPVANNDSYATNQGVTLTVAAPGVLANDTDVDGNPLTAALVTGPVSGSLTLNPNGSFTYTPNANFSGTDTFTYRAKDGTLDSNLATVTVTVNGSNSAPVAADDCYTTNEDTPLTVPLPGLLANDSDADGNALTVVLIAGPAHGTLTLNANGSFTYTPNSNFNGDDTFTYRANDGTTDSNIAKVTITVCPINDAPVANNDSYITNLNTPLTVTIPGVLANDTDAEGSALTAVLNSGPAHGTLTLNANGSFTYASTTGYTGSDSFTYRASDGTTTSAIATVVITVNPVANAPLVTAPASITIAATSAGGATAITSPLLAAFLASGWVVDSTDPAPVRLTPQINGVDVTSSTQFALGTTAVTFRYKNANGQIGTATSYVNIIVGTVSITNSITGKGVDASGNYYVDLKLTNTGTGNAMNLAITEATFRTLTGTGSVSLLNPGTITVGDLAAGASTTIHILLNRPVTVKRFSFTQNMSFEDVTGASFSASALQTIIP